MAATETHAQQNHPGFQHPRDAQCTDTGARAGCDTIPVRAKRPAQNAIKQNCAAQPLTSGPSALLARARRCPSRRVLAFAFAFSHSCLGTRQPLVPPCPLRLCSRRASPPPGVVRAPRESFPWGRGRGHGRGREGWPYALGRGPLALTSAVCGARRGMEGQGRRRCGDGYIVLFWKAGTIGAGYFALPQSLIIPPALGSAGNGLTGRQSRRLPYRGIPYLDIVAA